MLFSRLSVISTFIQSPSFKKYFSEFTCLTSTIATVGTAPCLLPKLLLWEASQNSVLEGRLCSTGRAHFGSQKLIIYLLSLNAYFPAFVRPIFCAICEVSGLITTTYPLQNVVNALEPQIGQTSPPSSSTYLHDLHALSCFIAYPLSLLPLFYPLQMELPFRLSSQGRLFSLCPFPFHQSLTNLLFQVPAASL